MIGVYINREKKSHLFHNVAMAAAGFFFFFRGGGDLSFIGSRDMNSRSLTQESGMLTNQTMERPVKRGRSDVYISNYYTTTRSLQQSLALLR